MTPASLMPEHATEPKRALRRPLPGLFLLIVLAIVAAAAAGGLSIWVPHLQRERAIARIQRLGGTVTSADVPGNWRDRALQGLRGEPSRRVVAVDLSAARLTNDDLQLLTPFADVEAISLQGRRLSDDGLNQLKELHRLRFLMLVDCRNISDEAVAELQKRNPGLQVTRRGAALLGIYGRRGLLGCRIVSVRPGTAAERGGLLRGDEITWIGNRRIRSFESLVEEIARRQPGEAVTLRVNRGSGSMKLPVKLGAWSDSK